MTGPLQHWGGDLRNLIIDNVANCNESSLPGMSGNTILMEAVSLGDVELVKKVLEFSLTLQHAIGKWSARA